MGIFKFFNNLLEAFGKTITVGDTVSFQRAMKRLTDEINLSQNDISTQPEISFQEKNVLELTGYLETFSGEIEAAKNTVQEAAPYFDSIQQEISVYQQEENNQWANIRSRRKKKKQFQSEFRKINFCSYQDDLHTIECLREKISAEQSKDVHASQERVSQWKTRLETAKKEMESWEERNAEHHALREGLDECLSKYNAFSREIQKFDKNAAKMERKCNSILTGAPSKQHREVERKLHLFQEQKEQLQLWQDYIITLNALKKDAESRLALLTAEKTGVNRQQELLNAFKPRLDSAIQDCRKLEIQLLKRHCSLLQKLIQTEEQDRDSLQIWLSELSDLEQSVNQKETECQEKARSEKALFQKTCQIFLDNAEGYISWTTQQSLEPLYQKLINSCQASYAPGLDLSPIGLTEPLPIRQWVEAHNRQFLASSLECFKDYFDQMLPCSLDDQQRRAILADEDYMQVIAGAGSGKTTTIQAKVKYLTEKKHVPPEKILLLAFNRSAKEEMKNRINDKMGIPVSIHTFHSFGLSVIKGTLGAKHVHEENREQTISTSVKCLIARRSQENSSFAQKLLEFSILYQIEPKSMYDFDKMDSYYKMLGNIGFSSIQASLRKHKAAENEAAQEYQMKQALQGEQVRSYEELVIANYLFLSGIKYEYESVFPEEKWGSSGNKPYTPDFYLPDYDLYWEHFGIDKNGRLPHLTENEERWYLSTMDLKRKRYQELNMDLIETYSWQFSDGQIYQELDKTLEKHHIEKQPIPASEVIQQLMENAKNRLFNQSVSLIESYLSLYKSRWLKKEDLEKAKQWIPCTTDFAIQRRELFFDVFEEIFDEYEQTLEKEDELDFNDMIAMAFQQIQDKRYIVPFDYIIVDEYQDMSYSRHELLKSLVLQKFGTKLFGVGDDWQSIYRFTGSDLDYFTSFDKYWPHSLQLKIENTHRNSQQLVDAAGSFIMKNPGQIPKSLKSGLQCSQPIRIFQYANYAEETHQLQPSYTAIHKAIQWLKQQDQDLLADKDILILGRNNATVDEIKSFTHNRHQYSTVHRSKGSEAKAVILADVLDGISGFPNQIQDDPILQSLLAAPEAYPYAEERRLFYVALTRTQKYIAITTSEWKPSCFVNELLQDTLHVTVEKITETAETEFVSDLNAPICKLCKGRMVLRRNRKNGNLFWGCSNYSDYFDGCKYTQDYFPV